jgi:hypothetical protein
MATDKEKLNVNVLVNAKIECMNYLKDSLAPYIAEGIISIYDDAVETQRKLQTYEYTRQFQTLLKKIKEWNATILITETKRIVDGLDYPLQKLIAAYCISQTKILTAIRLGPEVNIDISLPSTDRIIHNIYINVARKIYTSRDLLECFEDIHYNKKHYDYILDVIKETIEETIKAIIPVKKILIACLDMIDNAIQSKKDGTDPDGTDIPGDADVSALLNQFGSLQEGTEEPGDFDSGLVSGEEPAESPVDEEPEFEKFEDEGPITVDFTGKEKSTEFNVDKTNDFESTPGNEFGSSSNNEFSSSGSTDFDSPSTSNEFGSSGSTDFDSPSTSNEFGSSGSTDFDSPAFSENSFESSGNSFGSNDIVISDNSDMTNGFGNSGGGNDGGDFDAGSSDTGFFDASPTESSNNSFGSAPASTGAVSSDFVEAADQNSFF